MHPTHIVRPKKGRISFRLVDAFKGFLSSTSFFSSLFFIFIRSFQGLVILIPRSAKFLSPSRRGTNDTFTVGRCLMMLFTVGSLMCFVGRRETNMKDAAPFINSCYGQRCLLVWLPLCPNQMFSLSSGLLFSGNLARLPLFSIISSFRGIPATSMMTLMNRIHFVLLQWAGTRRSEEIRQSIRRTSNTLTVHLIQLFTRRLTGKCTFQPLLTRSHTFFFYLFSNKPLKLRSDFYLFSSHKSLMNDCSEGLIRHTRWWNREQCTLRETGSTTLAEMETIASRIRR